MCKISRQWDADREREEFKRFSTICKLVMKKKSIETHHLAGMSYYNLFHFIFSPSLFFVTHFISSQIALCGTLMKADTKNKSRIKEYKIYVQGNFVSLMNTLLHVKSNLTLIWWCK